MAVAMRLLASLAQQGLSCWAGDGGGGGGCEPLLPPRLDVREVLLYNYNKNS